MIRIVAGTAGSGKTHYVRQEAAKLAKAGERTAILVPEQFSFETERAMLELLSPREADRAEVFSFTRLAAKLGREVGGVAGRRLDEAGRAAVMHRAMAAVQDHLTLYGGRRGQDTVARMLAAVSECKNCAITPAMLEEAAGDVEESVLSRKLTELSLVYGAYDALMGQIGSIDPLDDLTRLARQLDELPYFEGMTVFADSFTGFTGQEWNVLRKIIGHCECFVITLCCDRETREGAERSSDLFAAVRHTADELLRLDGQAEWQWLEGHPRFVSPSLRAAEERVFRPRAFPAYEEDAPDAVIYAADDPYDEAAFAAREMRRLMREEGFRRRDFALICRTASDYQTKVLRALAMQGIPCFCDRRVPVTDLPLVRFVLAAADIVNGRWRSEDILRWLKTGMVDGMGVADIARLENYCFVWGVKGAKWRETFTQSPYGYSDRPPEDGDALLAKIESLRARVTELLEPFEQAVKDADATGRDMAAAFWRLIDDAGAARCIERMLPKLSPEDADVQGQSWNALMSLLDQLAAILEDTRLSFRECCDLLTLMIGQCDVGRIPQSADEAVFGAADRIRTANPRAVFVLGANDGVFPLLPSPGGIFTESERRLLIGKQLPLSGDEEDSAVSERFLAYAAMTCATERLYVTYSRSDGGEALYPSEIVTELRRALPHGAFLRAPEVLSLAQIEGEEAGFLLAAGCVGRDDPFARALTECYRRRPAYADRLEVVRSANARQRPVLRDKANARALFGRHLRISASKAESFFRCRFQYFCQYGLKALPRRRAELDPMEYGSVVHYVLERLLKEHDVSVLAAEEDLKGLITPYLEAYLHEVMGGREMKSARFLYLFGRLADTLTALAAQLGEEFAESLFTPYAFELPIGEDGVKPLRLALKDGASLTVGGSIDRVDIFTKDGVKYVRVVDYKTGSKEFVLSDVLSGLNMQMLIYLDILCDPSLCGEGFAPAGVVYSPAALRGMNGVRGETTFDAVRQEALRKNGLLIDDPDVIDAMESGMEKKVDKNANATVKNADTFHAPATYVADAAQFRLIRQYVREMLREMGEALTEGDIDALPAKGTYDACEYCDYRTLCTQERKASGRDIRKRRMAETLKAMEESGIDE